MFLCPACGSNKLLVYEEQAWELDTGEFYCHSVKSHDDDAKVRCRDSSCAWTGFRYELHKDSE